ncbi:MAG TPA: SpoIIE family protein phosphatase, partial [Bryobacteraceae bacterium]|nr:SpoIIE family protein phosphatase [Bryobacteraceae bacterium]
MGSLPPRDRAGLAPAYLLVRSPTGAETRLPVSALPFRIGREGDNELVLRDNRVSRHHAKITAADGSYRIADLRSSYGVFINGERVQQGALNAGDHIDFGVPDSYRLTFELGEAPVVEGASALGKLRATLEVARALQSSLSIDDVLSAVVEAALTVTGCERGFLLLRAADDLQIRVARSRTGLLTGDDLKVPTRLLWRALRQRREFLSMNFDPDADANRAELSVYSLELRSVVCVPLVEVRTGSTQLTQTITAADDTIGLLYMDSRAGHADLSAGGRELLTTLALEASTVLENARLLEQQWARQRIEQELRIARQIQESLLPRSLPDSGWFRAAASSIPSLEVGGDYVDIRKIADECWAVVMVDISGKGVGAAILASLLQGMFLASPYSGLTIEEMFRRVNRYLNERTGGEQYATAFYGAIDRTGRMHWLNAGHPPALLLRASGELESLEATGTPIGMLEDVTFGVEVAQLSPGDRLVVYTDGLIEAQNFAHQFYGLPNLRSSILANAGRPVGEFHRSILAALQSFTQNEPQRDDITLAVADLQNP